MAEETLKKTIIIGLSGPSSSGKTTLARLLRDIYNVSVGNRSIKLFVIHEDDFYKTDTEIPTVQTPAGHTFQDWDCAESLDLTLLESSLSYIHKNGSLPPTLNSKEDLNNTGPVPVTPSEIESAKAQVRAWLSSLTIPSLADDQQHDDSTTTESTPHPKPHYSSLSLSIFILEGFLLYSHPSNPSLPPTITTHLDLNLFLRCTYALTSSRRSARPGYVTLEGFWKDPDGYVDEVVWPNYVREHAWMFEAGDVDHGDVRSEVSERFGVEIGPEKGEAGMGEVLRWGVERVEVGVERLLES